MKRQELHFLCKEVADTQALAKQIGEVLRGGEVFEFYSDLGGGKTTFTKGLAKGLGVTDVVQSPTFTISQIHSGMRGLELHHFDFYRLNDAGVMKAELAESLQQPNAVVAIEWGEIVHGVLPDERISVTLRTLEDESRMIILAIPEKFQHLISRLQQYKEQGSIA